MTWQLFTIIQIAIFASAALAALGVRNFRLRRRNEQLMTLCGQAHEELVAVSGKLAAIETTLPPEKMLAERLKGLAGDDPIVTVRRMVLEQEIKPKPDFATRLMEHLTSQDDGPPAEEEFARRWRSTREECQQLAKFPVADNPEILPAIRQLFQVIEPLDKVYQLDLPALELPPSNADQPTDDADRDAPPADESAGATTEAARTGTG
jgi:hypothetical protein